MDLDRKRIYTSVNAGELEPGDKVIVANNIGQLIDKVKQDYPVKEINGYADGYKERRFLVNDGFSYALAYLVERKENCTNCGGRTTCIRQKPEHPELTKCCNYKHYECSEYKPKTEQKAEKHYRPSIQGHRRVNQGVVYENGFCSVG